MQRQCYRDQCMRLAVHCHNEKEGEIEKQGMERVCMWTMIKQSIHSVTTPQLKSHVTENELYIIVYPTICELFSWIKCLWRYPSILWAPDASADYRIDWDISVCQSKLPRYNLPSLCQHWVIILELRTPLTPAAGHLPWVSLNRKSTSEERNICSLKMSIRLGVLSVRIVPAANYVLTLPEEQRRFSDDAISWSLVTTTSF